MSRIGKHPVPVPAGVQVKIDGQKVVASGKLGELGATLCDEIDVTLDDGKVVVVPRNETRRARTLWATSRTVVSNLVAGVSQGFTKQLEITGVGYRAAVQGNELVLQLGYSHEIRYPIPNGINVKCERPTAIEVSGADRQKVGQVAAEVRAFRPPEPFKGKGIRYADEVIFRKEGKKK